VSFALLTFEALTTSTPKPFSPSFSFDTALATALCFCSFSTPYREPQKPFPPSCLFSYIPKIMSFNRRFLAHSNISSYHNSRIVLLSRRRPVAL